MKFIKSCAKVWGIKKAELEKPDYHKDTSISKANVSNIKKHMKYSKSFHSEDSTSTDLIVTKLQQSFNCIIVYKPQGQPFQTSPYMYDDINVRKKTYLYLEFKPKND